MGIIPIIFIAVSLAMDAFAVSVSNGITAKGFNKAAAVKQSLYFGFFQFGMTFLGWFLGSRVKSYIEAVDHWIAFILLAAIGFNMVREYFKGEEDEKGGTELNSKTLALQAVATSIDALAVGIGFAMLEVNIVLASVIIGIITYIISFIGGIMGTRAGGLFSKRAELLGGIILIGIGVKILIEHLFF